MSRTWFGRRERADSRHSPGPATTAVEPAGATGATTAAGVAEPQPEGSRPVLTINALGRKCPIPIIMLAEQIRDVPVGEVIAVLADDPAAYTDVPAWCGMKSHEFVFRQELDSGWSFGIRRRY